MHAELRKWVDLKQMLDVFIDNLTSTRNEEQCADITGFLIKHFQDDYFTGQEFLMYKSNLRYDDIRLVIDHWKYLIDEKNPLK